MKGFFKKKYSKFHIDVIGKFFSLNDDDDDHYLKR